MLSFCGYREKFLPLQILFPIFVHLGSCCCPRGLEEELLCSMERSCSHGILSPHFAEPTDTNHWDNMTLTSTRTFSRFLASIAFGDLLNTSEKSHASLIRWCAPALFAPSRVWKASRTAAWLTTGQVPHSSWLCLLTSAWMDRQNPAGGDLAAGSLWFGANGGKPRGAQRGTRHLSKRSWTPKLT